MTRTFITFLTFILLTIGALPLMTVAEPAEHHHSKQMPALDWKAYPADIQVMKNELDKMRSKQKQIFEQMKALSIPVSKIAEQLKVSRISIMSLRKQKHAAWDGFSENAKSQNWQAAKSDLQSVISLKRQIIEKQQDMLKLQQKLINLLNSSSASPLLR